MRRLQSTFFILASASANAFANSAYNLPPGVSPISHDIYQLHMTIFWICVAIGVVVFGAMFYAMFHFRKSKGAIPAHFHSNLFIEIAWTIIPFIILIGMAIPATKVLIRMSNTAQEELTIRITGYQWKWHYEYLEDNVSFFSNLATSFDEINNKIPKTAQYLREVDNPVVVPIHKKIRFLVTSNDVNHAWWVPDLGVKRDAIPGFINEAWVIIDKPGTYYGQCAEMCGINHAFMPITIIAMSEDGYKNWISLQKGGAAQAEAQITKKWTMQELMAQGEKVYLRICAACHQPTGLGLPPSFPALKGSKKATGPIETHIDTVLNGVSGTAMQAFKNQLNEIDLASVITYERNAFGNNTNTSVQPAEIKALKEGKPMSAAVYSDTNASTPPASGDKEAAPTTSNSPSTQTGVANENAPTMPPAQSEADVAARGTTQSANLPQQPVPATADTLKAVTINDLMAKGEKLYLGTCAVCHQATGAGMPPTFPALKGSPVALGPVDVHIKTVLFGRPNTAMQAFKDQFSNDELAAIITYERNAWGNNTGTTVQPSDIQAQRDQALVNNKAGAAK